MLAQQMADHYSKQAEAKRHQLDHNLLMGNIAPDSQTAKYWKSQAEWYQSLANKWQHRAIAQKFAYEAGFNAALELMAGQLPHKYWTRVTQEEGK